MSYRKIWCFSHYLSVALAVTMHKKTISTFANNWIARDVPSITSYPCQLQMSSTNDSSYPPTEWAISLYHSKHAGRLPGRPSHADSESGITSEHHPQHTTRDSFASLAALFTETTRSCYVRLLRSNYKRRHTFDVSSHGLPCSVVYKSRRMICIHKHDFVLYERVWDVADDDGGGSLCKQKTRTII